MWGKTRKITLPLCMALIIMVLVSCSEETTPYYAPYTLTSNQVEVYSEAPAQIKIEPQVQVEHSIITQRSLPQTMRPPRPRETSEKELVEYPTLEVEANVFFKTESAIRSAILAENGTVFFGNEDNVFYAVDISTEQILWTFSTDEAVRTLPVLTDGNVIFNAGNNLYILDASTGEQVHIIIYPSSYDVRMSDDPNAFNDSHIAVADGVVYFVALNGDLVAVDILSGEIIWTIEMQSRRLVVSGVNYYDGRLYYILSPGHLFAVDIQTRQVVFETHLVGMPFNPMTIYNGSVYVGGRCRLFYNIDASTGEVLWRSYSQDSLTWFSGGSVVVGNNVFAATSDEYAIIVFDKGTGEFQRIYSILSFGYTPPLRHGNNVVVVSTNMRAAFVGPGIAADEMRMPRTYAMEIDTYNHTKLWAASLDDIALSPPTIYQGVLFFGSDSGTVYSIDLNRF